MKRIVSTAFLFLLVSLQPALAKTLNIGVSIVPQKYFVEKIAGRHAKITVMVPPGASPATYEPKPQQMLKLAQTDIYFSIGVPFEKPWLPKFRAASKDMILVRTDKRIRKNLMPHHHHHHDHDHDHDAHHNEHAENDHDHHDDHDAVIRDPHIWLSPTLVRLQADLIRDTLIKQDPANAADYRANHAAFVKEIQLVDQKLLSIFSKQKQSLAFFVFHPAWGYFAQDYGLEQNALELEGKAPSPKTLAKVIEKARKKHISVIFAQPEFSQKTAKAVAKAINGHVVRLSPLAYDWSENLLRAANAFIEAQNNRKP